MNTSDNIVLEGGETVNILSYSKAIVPIAVLGVLTILATIGVTADMRVEDAVTLLLTAFLVWLVPNKK